MEFTEFSKGQYDGVPDNNVMWGVYFIFHPFKEPSLEVVRIVNSSIKPFQIVE